MRLIRAVRREFDGQAAFLDDPGYRAFATQYLADHDRGPVRIDVPPDLQARIGQSVRGGPQRHHDTAVDHPRLDPRQHAGRIDRRAEGGRLDHSRQRMVHLRRGHTAAPLAQRVVELDGRTAVRPTGRPDRYR